ncbi:MAG: sigma-54 dependent transcriptional regulator, partial [Sphingomonas sp.]
MIEDAARLLLLVDEEPAQARLVAAIAARAGWRLLRAADVGQALDVLAQQPVGAAIVDHWGSEGEGAAIVARLHAAAPAVPILMLTARSSVGLAVAAMRAGAADFLAKPISPDRLLAALDLVAKPAAPGELRPLTEKLATPLAFDEIVGSAPAFRAAMAIAAKAARARVSVLAEGESGVGKEVIAHAIHAASPRARKPMVVVGCGAIPSKLADSELFGHERGAFTGAFERTLGRFVEADGGTLLLDDVGELPMETQARLLRVLQSGEVQPLGGRATRSVDVRIIATSSRPLLEQIAAGKFREDLYYRLAVVQLTIPPLRTRSGDIPALVRHLLARIAEHPGIRPLGITEGALALLMRYEWPGNVRQLQNAL